MALSLRINIIEKSVTKTLQFDPSTNIADACKIIRDKCSELPDLGQLKDYGLFLPGEMYGTGAWLEPSKTLDYYLLRNGDIIEYRRKIRCLNVRTLDGTNKKMMVDDSQNLANLMVVICTKMGITNHDEYSLVRDLPDEIDGLSPQQQNNYGTLTLRRKREEKERDAKMEQLRKKLKTDDDLNWVDHTKTLREQGIEENETLTLRRKFFFSDQNIDSHDPVQLNLLYVQARDAILDGTHPVTENKACEFAGIQCQIQFGDHNSLKHRPGFLDLKDCLPMSYLKTKGIEKKVFMDHRRHVGLSELDAKSLYTRKARSLPTYGVTFFLVKEKMDGKNKLVPRLLGVTKDSVLRLDERTKEIMKTWPLTTVRRWAASPNTFTLDFGDYSDQYYSVQTAEGEQIAQLIAGYIDIILRKKQAKDHLGIEGDEGSTLIEDMVSPYKATIVQRQIPEKPMPLHTDSVAKPAVLHAGPESMNVIQTGQLQSTQYSTIRGQLEMTRQSQTSTQQLQERDLMSSTQYALRSGHESIEKSREYLDTPLNLPPLGNDPASRKWREATLDTKKQNIQSQIASMSAATAHVVTMTSGGLDEVDSGAMGEAFSNISSSLPEVAKDVRMISALMENSGDSLLEATRKLCNAFSDLLNAAEPNSHESRQNLLGAAGRIGESSRTVLNIIGESDQSQDLLLGLAKNVANSSAALVVQARKCANSIEEHHRKEEVITSAANIALSASELVACAKVVAPTISNQQCRDELFGASRKVGHAVESVSSACNQHVRDKVLLDDLQMAARNVTESLNRLIDHIRPQTRASIQESTQEGPVDRILVATDKILTSEDSADMVRQARILAEATAQLIQAIKGEAEKTPDSEVQRKLIAAAKVLAEATSKLVEAAKQCASHPNTPKSQDLLRQAASDLREATNFASSGAVQKKMLRRLESSAKNAASAAYALIAAGQSASPHCSNANFRESMSSDCRAVADTIPNLVSSVKSSFQVSDETAQSSLIEATEKFLRPSNSLVNTTKNASNFIEESSAARHLTQCSQKLAIELIELRTALDRIKTDSGITAAIHPKKQMESASVKVRELKEEVLEFKKAASKRDLKPLPNDNPQNAIQRLTSSVRKVGTTTDQMVISVVRSDTNQAIQAAQGLSNGLGDLVSASRSVSSTNNNDQRVLQTTEEVLERSWTLLRECSAHIGSHETAQEKDSQLGPLAKGVHDALDKVTNSIPGQREIEESINHISEVSIILDDTESRLPSSNKNYGQLQNDLQQLATEVSDSANEVVSTSANPAKLGHESKFFSGKVVNLIHTGYHLSNLHEDINIREEIILTLKNVSNVTSNFLIVASSTSANPNAPGVRNQLTQASRGVNESLNQLIDCCSSAAPGQKECDSAVRRIQALKPLLDNPNEPLNTASYFDCQQIVVEKSKLLGEGMTGIANYAKEGRLDHFGASVNSSAEAIVGLIEGSCQAAYLLAASEPSSVAGRPGLVDMHAINQSSANIRSACQILSSPNVSQPQILGAATTIAKHTSALCTACRVASERTHDTSIKRQFVQLAKDVANSTATLVKEIKALDHDHSEGKKEMCSRATDSLIKSVNSLIQYSSQPDFTSIPAKISPKGRAIQEPIIHAGRNVIEGSSNMLLAAKSLALNPKDPPVWQKLAQHSKHVSDSIKKLVTALREKAPSQKECELSISKLKDLLRELHQATHDADGGNLPPRKNNTIQGFIQNAENSLRMAEEHLGPLRNAGRSEAESLGHQVTSMVAIVDNLVVNIISSASNISEHREQFNLLERTRTVLESCLQLVCAAKESGGNPKATTLHPELDLSAQCFQEGLDDLKISLERISSGAGSLVASMSESISAAMVKLDQVGYQSGKDESFVEFQTRMIHTAKEIARLSQEMVTKSAHEPNSIPVISSELSHNYINLSNDARGAIALVVSQDVGKRIRSGVQELGKTCIELVRFGGVCQFSSGDAFAHRDLSDTNRVVSEKVSDILAALQAGSRGTQACINAASAVSGIIGDLDTTIMFATAGTLHSETDEIFADHRENILKTAKALVEDTKTLVAGAASTQEQLSVAAQNAVATIIQLTEAVKSGASSLGSNNPESQVMLINSVRDVAAALYDLIHATKNAAGKNANDQSMITLKESAKIMVTNVTSLLKTVKAVEDEHTRGTRALEATIEAIAQEIRAFDSPEIPRGRPTNPDELVRATKPLSVSVSKAVSAGFSCKQDDVIVAANMGRKTISDLLTASKSSAFAVDGELRERTLIEARKIAVFYREVLQYVLYAINHPGEDVKDKLSACSRSIATSITDLVACAQLMKVVNNQLSANPMSMLGHAIHNSTYYNNHKGGEFVDPEDPTVIAENELLGAANSIDAAAKKLERLRPRKSIKVKKSGSNISLTDEIMENWTYKSKAVKNDNDNLDLEQLKSDHVRIEEIITQLQSEADESLNFDEMILEAAKSIAAATSAIVKAASAAQRELVDSGRVSRKPASESDDGQWSEGLVSAAQMVAAATHSLVESANALVQGYATEEKLISAAKQVASSTAQLLVACKVKASPDSDATKRLQLAGNAVKRATDNLVKAAQQALDQEVERQLILNKTFVGGIAQEINARSEVLIIERQLEEARAKLAAIRKAKYQEQTGGLIGYEDSDIEIDMSLIQQEPSRLDTLLESSAERINNTTNAFNIIRQQNQTKNQNQPHYATPIQSSTPTKPIISPKPVSKFMSSSSHNQSQQYSTISPGEFNQSSAHQIPTPPVRSFHNQSSSQTPPIPPPPSTSHYAVPGQHGHGIKGYSSQSGGDTTSGGEELYSKPIYSTPSSTSSTPTVVKQFMKPSDFVKSPVPKTFGHVQSQQGSPASQYHQSQEQQQQEGGYSQEYSHYDSGPIESQRVYENTDADGNISLKRIFQKSQQSSSYVTSSQQQQHQSSRKVFQQQHEESDSSNK